MMPSHDLKNMQNDGLGCPLPTIQAFNQGVNCSSPSPGFISNKNANTDDNYNTENINQDISLNSEENVFGRYTVPPTMMYTPGTQEQESFDESEMKRKNQNSGNGTKFILYNGSTANEATANDSNDIGTPFSLPLSPQPHGDIKTRTKSSEPAQLKSNNSSSSGLNSPITASHININNIANINIDSISSNFNANKSRHIKFTPNRTSQNIRTPHLLLTANARKAKNDVLKGPPKNSRFFRFFGAETSKNSKSSSTHHYNPYRYPQNRNKVNPHPDFINGRKEDYQEQQEQQKQQQTQTQTQLPSQPQLLQQPLQQQTPPQSQSQSQSQSQKKQAEVPVEQKSKIPRDGENFIPILRPTVDEFSDVIEYVESIKELGEKYGAVKIIPPEKYIPTFSINLESFWIKSQRQLWNSPSDELNARCIFYKELQEVLIKTNVPAITKLPCIDKRAIDLYRLHRAVNLRGGFEQCCAEKLWAQIGRELGFYGKISSSLSSSIKSVYQRYVLPWDKERREMGKETIITFDQDEHLRIEQKRQKIDANGNYLPRIIGSAATYSRERELLVNTGFNPYFDQATTQKKSITLNDNHTLPVYDFYNWHESSNIDDCSPLELKISSLYTLRQFHEKSRILKHQLIHGVICSEDEDDYENPKILEQGFWKLFKDPKLIFETEVAYKQSTKIHESGLEFKPTGEKSHGVPDSVFSAWNLSNTPIVNGSILKHIATDADSILYSSLSFSMFYGAQCWSIEDHWLYNIDYQYLGDPKAIYVIPPKFQEKFENLMRSLIDLKHKDEELLFKDYNNFEKVLQNPDIFASSLENQVPHEILLPRCKPNDGNFAKFVDSINNPIRFNEDIMLSPEFLKDHGIDVFRTFQEPGEFIIKFPKSYSSSISLGTSVNESACFATPNWIDISKDACNWLKKQQIMPRFSNFAMLLSAASDSNNEKVLKKIQTVLRTYIGEELKKRKQIRSFLKETKISDGNRQWQRVTDVDLVDAFPTFIAANNVEDPSSQFTMSLDFLLDLNSKGFEGIKNTKFEMISIVSDDYLRDVLNLLEKKLGSPQDWLSKYQEVIAGYDKPSIQLVTPLLDEGKSIFAKMLNQTKESLCNQDIEALEAYEYLKTQVELSSKWVEKASKFLVFKNSDRTILNPEHEDVVFSVENLNNVEELNELLNEISKLPISAGEMNQLIELANGVTDFDSTAISVLNGTKKDVDIKSLYISGQSLGVKLDSLLFLDRIVRRNDWLEKVTKGYTSEIFLKALVDEGKNVASSRDEATLNDLEDLMNKTIIAQRQLDIIFKTNESPIPVEELIKIYKNIHDLPLNSDLKNKVVETISDYEILKKDVNNIKQILLEKVANGRSEFSEEIDLAINHSNQLFATCSPDQIGWVISKMSSMTEFAPDLQFFKDKLISKPQEIEVKLKEKFPGLVTFGKDDSRFKNITIVDSLRYCRAYNQDIFEGPNDRYCVCRQSHEMGSMVECESCKEWFHFHCIGFNDTGNAEKYICPICDLEQEYPSTRLYYSCFENKEKYKEIIAFAEECVQNKIVLTPVLKEFLEASKRFFNFKQKVKADIQYEGDKIVDQRLLKIKNALRKFGACSIDFVEDRKALQQRFKELSTAKNDSGIVHE